jgi:hypothetical protein
VRESLGGLGGRGRVKSGSSFGVWRRFESINKGGRRRSEERKREKEREREREREKETERKRES